MARWQDLLDPGAAALRDAAPWPIGPQLLERLAAPADPGLRPGIVELEERLVAFLVVPVVERKEDLLFLQEVDLLAATDEVVTVRKTPEGRPPFDLEPVRELVGDDPTAAELLHRIVDEVAEHYLDLVDDLDDEIEELEDAIEELPAARVRTRIAELRRDVLVIRRTLAPTRDAIRRVVDGRVLPEAPKGPFGDVYDKLLRASEGLEFSRDLIAALRDHEQARISIEQNEVVKRLTVIASLVLIPTFLVGVWGQNFRHMPELEWRLGYAFSWAVIVVVTIAQLVVFRRLRWI